MVRMVSTVEGRAELVEQGLAREVDVQACSPADFAAISPETLFSFATGQHTTRLSPRASAAHNATLWTVYIGLVHAIKKRYERGMAQRLTLGEGETGGRYRCVAPERLFRPGLPSLMNDAHVETLRRERIVVVDGVLPKDALELARAEAQVMARSGHLKGEPNASCNPGEVSLEMDLSDPRDLSNLRRATLASTNASRRCGTYRHSLVRSSASPSACRRLSSWRATLQAHSTIAISTHTPARTSPPADSVALPVVGPSAGRTASGTESRARWEGRAT